MGLNRETIVSALSRVRGRGFFSVFFGSVCSKFVAFLGSVLIVRILSKDAYGILGYMENLYGYIYVLAGYGLGNAVLRYIVLKDGMAEKKGVLDYALSHGTIFNIVLVLAGMSFAFLYPHSSEFSEAAWLLPIMLLALPFQFVYDACQLTLRALLKNAAYALCAVLCVVVSSILKVSGASLFGLDGAVFAFPLTFLIMGCMVALYVYSRYFKGVKAEKIPKEHVPEITSYSLQFMVTNGLWMLFAQNDILILGMITGDALQVADFKVALALPAVLSLVSSSIGIVIGPYFIKREKDRVWVWASYRKVLLMSTVFIGGVALVMGWFAPTLIGFVYGEQYEDVADLMRLLLLAAFFNTAIRYTSANLLAAMGKVKYNLVIAVVGLVAQIILDIALIASFGGVGAALSSILVFAFMGVATAICFVKLYRTKGL